MKKSVTLTRALKEKNRIAGRIEYLRSIVQQYNSRYVHEKSRHRIRKLIATEADLVERLVEIKAAIAAASVGIFPQIAERGEIEARIQWLRSVNTFSGTMELHRKSVECKADISSTEKDRLLGTLQDRSDALKDAIDAYNDSTQVKIEIGCGKGIPWQAPYRHELSPEEMLQAVLDL